MADTRLFELADGRELAWIECGAIGGAPVVAIHGTPGTRHAVEPLSEVAASKDVRLISPDRPGYGHSTYDPARSFERWARDVDQLADHLRIGRFAVVGVSGGGPNAAACARFLGDRLGGCAIVSGLAPPEGNVSTETMLRMNRVLLRLMPAAPRLVGLALGAAPRRAKRDPDQALAWMRRSLPACDVAVIERAMVLAVLREEFARPVPSTAGRAQVQDFQLIQRPWRFRLADIEIPVHVWHGDLAA